MVSPRTKKPDTVLIAAIDVAHQSLLETVDPDHVGEPCGFDVEDDRVVTHHFEAHVPGYTGWRWSVTLSRASRQRKPTVNEIVLLPGPDALTAPEWLPWRERITKGDLGPGDLLPTDEKDSRLVPAFLSDEYTGVDPESEWLDDLGLRRERVISREGRDDAADRWHSGDHGPDTDIARAAPAPCATCGFLVGLSGPLGTMFGACANEFSPDDGRVVAFDHGCGAHSQVRLGTASPVEELPAPVLDTIGYDDLEPF
ncbi:MAG: DUF3027 domain-containing protein [Propionibacteriales bacterium]|nr:DUF3027 domain-containing protein [Propionibacteriales bacterium]